MEPHSIMRNDHAGSSGTASIDRALNVLEELVNAGGAIALADLAARAALPKPTAHRMLRRLAERGYARTEGDGRYMPGARILTLAGRVLDSLGYAELVRPALLELRTATQETLHFGMLSGGQAVYVSKIEGERPYRMASTVGMPLLLHCTAIGKAILAHLPSDERADLIRSRELVARTPRTLTTATALEADLAEARSRGFTVDDEENEEGIRCVGAPVFGNAGRVVGAISVSAPAFQVPLSDALALAPAVIGAARTASLALGAPSESLPAAHRMPALGGRPA